MHLCTDIPSKRCLTRVAVKAEWLYSDIGVASSFCLAILKNN